MYGRLGAEPSRTKVRRRYRAEASAAERLSATVDPAATRRPRIPNITGSTALPRDAASKITQARGIARASRRAGRRSRRHNVREPGPACHQPKDRTGSIPVDRRTRSSGARSVVL
jgi:hypothetical protein